MTLVRMTLVGILGFAPLIFSLALTEGSKEGQGCKVVGGANKGQSGTYDKEGSCSGNWGATDCSDQYGQNNQKCVDAKHSATPPKGTATNSVNVEGTKQIGGNKQPVDVQGSDARPSGGGRVKH
jgi:hypothetical protein